MDIRSITLFCDPHFDRQTAARFLAAARHAFPYPVQSARLATPPFPDWAAASPSLALVPEITEMAQQWQAAGVNYLSIGPVHLHHDPGWIDLIPALLTTTGILFTAVEIADTNGRIDLDRCRRMAQLIQETSTLLDNGFGNLYLTALANCPPGSPFFPVAYHAGGTATFALAIEAADLALTAIQNSPTLPQAQENLIQAIEQTAAQLTTAAEAVAAAHHIPFSGIDFSLAPYPTPDKSLAGAMEALGLHHVGAPGTLFTAGFIADAIGQAQFKRCGFSGLMLPVLEDAVLAHRAGAGQVTVNDLLGCAAVCGVGLDTIPLPGDVSEASLMGILLDTAMLATRLNKPLTARLMPLPGLRAGEMTQFDFPYFANTQVMATTEGVTGLLQQSARLPIHAYHHRYNESKKR